MGGEWLSRTVDIGLTLAGLFALLPLLVFTAVAVYIDSGRPIFFGHERVGRGGRSFRCLKFRTMVPDAQRRLDELLANDPVARAEWARDHKLRFDPRITRLGSFLRKSSIDELPQLINVLFGNMSLVGPRPIVAAEIERYGRHYASYCSVRPGITGLWQVSGRNDVSYRKRVAMDVTYVRSKSLRLDAWIIISTVRVVLFQRGSY
jgi:exopolysaccharide production protein ExoY